MVTIVVSWSYKPKLPEGLGVRLTKCALWLLVDKISVPTAKRSTYGLKVFGFPQLSASK